MPKQKVNEAKFGEIKSYLNYHSVLETVDKYKVCKATAQQINKYNTYAEWREVENKKQREAFLARKAKLFKKGNSINFTPPAKPIDGTGRTANGDPFGDAVKPAPILPIGATKAPQQDGPIVTTKVDPNSAPMTFDEYRRAYQKYKELYEKAEEKQKELASDNANLQKKIAELEAEKMAKTQETKTESPTEIEITVGDATIKVSTRSKA